MDLKTQKKISFCITCMNRLHHLKKTLEKNILENYLLNDVEFIVLDYNSSDGLDEWVKVEMEKYITLGILVYYKTNDPKSYNRSHSRNMAFRLSRGELICNLDADNYLGNDFAKKMLKGLFHNFQSFYTSDCRINDVFGRIVVRRKNFLNVRGYNEDLSGYGFEDVDLFNRLIKNGLKHLMFSDPEFYNVISHSKFERISNESMLENLIYVYIYYNTPYTSEVLFFNKDNSCMQAEFIDNKHLHVLKEENDCLIKRFTDERNYVMLTKPVNYGEWFQRESMVWFNVDGAQSSFSENCDKFYIKNKCFYKINDNDLIVDILLTLSTAVNILESKKILCNLNVNMNGIGKGIVYKNFDYLKPIKLK
jgi:GT2 family glycosyltransferase